MGLIFLYNQWGGASRLWMEREIEILEPRISVLAVPDPGKSKWRGRIPVEPIEIPFERRRHRVAHQQPSREWWRVRNYEQRPSLSTGRKTLGSSLSRPYGTPDLDRASSAFSDNSNGDQHPEQIFRVQSEKGGVDDVVNQEAGQTRPD